MTADIADAKAKPKAGPHRWKPGESGNPRGMARGSRHKASNHRGKPARRRVQTPDQASHRTRFGWRHSGAEDVLERILPPVRERPCTFKLPPISTAAEAAACMARVLEGLASGEILPGEGAALGAAISGYVKILETTEIEARISALEAREKMAKDA